MKKAIVILLIMIAGIILVAVALFFLPRKTFLKVVSFSKENICRLRGGAMLENGYNPDGNLYECVVPYRDAGKACVRKDDCLGHCVVSNPAMPDLTGTCQKFELLNGRAGWELNDGSVSSFQDTMGVTP